MSLLNPDMTRSWLLDKLVLVGAELPHQDRLRMRLGVMGDEAEIRDVLSHANSPAQIFKGSSIGKLGLAPEVAPTSVLSALAAGIALAPVHLAMRLLAIAAMIALFWYGGFRLHQAGGSMLPLFWPVLGLLAFYVVARAGAMRIAAGSGNRPGSATGSDG